MILNNKKHSFKRDTPHKTPQTKRNKEKDIKTAIIKKYLLLSS
jgi:hypothetical protein